MALVARSISRSSQEYFLSYIMACVVGDFTHNVLHFNIMSIRKRY